MAKLNNQQGVGASLMVFQRLINHQEGLLKMREVFGTTTSNKNDDKSNAVFIDQYDEALHNDFKKGYEILAKYALSVQGTTTNEENDKALSDENNKA